MLAVMKDKEKCGTIPSTKLWEVGKGSKPSQRKNLPGWLAQWWWKWHMWPHRRVSEALATQSNQKVSSSSYLIYECIRKEAPWTELQQKGIYIEHSSKTPVFILVNKVCHQKFPQQKYFLNISDVYHWLCFCKSARQNNHIQKAVTVKPRSKSWLPNLSAHTEFTGTQNPRCSLHTVPSLPSTLSLGMRVADYWNLINTYLILFY